MTLLQPSRNSEGALGKFFRLLYGRNLYRLFEFFIPLIRSEFSFRSEIPKLIDHFCFNDIENLLGVDITTDVTLTLVAVYHVDAFLEVGNGIHWVAIKYLVPARIQNNQAIKHFKNV